MSGPPPKNPKTRARRNTTPTAAQLPAEAKRSRTPTLPEIIEYSPVYRDRELIDEETGDVVTMREQVGETPRPRQWHPLTVAWWNDVWASPMKSEFARVDVHRFFLLALLVDDFWRSPSIALATEIRLQEARFGLDSMSRRSLQWEIPDKPKRQRSSAPKQEKPKQDAPPPTAPIDPRQVLHAV